RGGRLGFALEAGECLRVFGYVVRQEFQGYKAAELHIFGFVDHPHATAAQLLDDAVVRYGLADHGLADTGAESYVGGIRKSMKPEKVCWGSLSTTDGSAPYAFRLRLMASLASLSAVRRRSVSRLSQSCLPLARASSTFTFPFLKYMRTGIRVRPFCWVLPISLRISSLCMSSLRVRRGAWLWMLPCS